MIVDIKNKTDIEIVDGCIQNIREYQYELFNRYHGKLKSICHRYIIDMDTVNDILQECFIKGYNSLNTLTNKHLVYAWLKIMVMHKAIDYQRTKKIKFEELRNIEIIDADIELNNNYIDPNIILNCIQQMSPSYRLVMNMRIDEFTHKDIAKKLNIKISTSKTNFLKGKNQLKKLILKHYNNNEILNQINKI